MLLPGLCHLVAEEKPRKILLQLGLHETLHSYFSYHWSIYDSFRTWLNQKKVSSEESEELEMMVANAKFEMNCSNYALISICNVLMNIAVLEPQFVDQQTVFFHILRFIMNVLPTVDNAGDYFFENYKIVASKFVYFRRITCSLWQPIGLGPLHPQRPHQ